VRDGEGYFDKGEGIRKMGMMDMVIENYIIF
jgi:hypothetical protein